MSDFNFSTFPILNTERLTLRQLINSDANDVFALRTDKAINKFIERPLERQDKNGQVFVDRITNSITKNNVMYWVISLKENPKLIGTICLWNFSEDKKVAEVGYGLSKNSQGKGFMNEALKAVLNYGFNILEFQTIEAFTHKNNTASINLLLKQSFISNDKRIDNCNKDNLIFIKHKG